MIKLEKITKAKCFEKRVKTLRVITSTWHINTDTVIPPKSITNFVFWPQILKSVEQKNVEKTYFFHFPSPGPQSLKNSLRYEFLRLSHLNTTKSYPIHLYFYNHKSYMVISLLQNFDGVFQSIRRTFINGPRPYFPLLVFYKNYLRIKFPDFWYCSACYSSVQ